MFEGDVLESKSVYWDNQYVMICGVEVSFDYGDKIAPNLWSKASKTSEASMMPINRDVTLYLTTAINFIATYKNAAYCRHYPKRPNILIRS